MLRVVLKILDASYLKALKRAIYFLSVDSIKFYFWEDKDTYLDYGFSYLILLTDTPPDSFTSEFSHVYQIFDYDQVIADIRLKPKRILHKEMSLQEIVNYLFHSYAQRRRGQLDICEIHLITGNSGGVGKSTFAKEGSRHSSEKSIYIELFDPLRKEGRNLEDLLWDQLDEVLTEGPISSSSPCELSISGLKRMKDLWQLEGLWLIDSLKSYMKQCDITETWLVIPSLLLPETASILQGVDYHWHLVDASREDAMPILRYWSETGLVNEETLIVYNCVHKGIHGCETGEMHIDIEHDAHLDKRRFSSQVRQIVLNREAIRKRSKWQPVQ